MNYMTHMKLYRVLYLIPLFLTILAVIICFALAGKSIRYPAAAILIGVFGGIFSVDKVRASNQIKRSIDMIRDYAIEDKMQAETPTVTVHYAITQSFVWSFQRHLCIPLDEISSGELCMVRYLNGPKSRAALWIYTKGGDMFYLLHYHGFLSDSHYKAVQSLANDLRTANPQISIH